MAKQNYLVVQPWGKDRARQATIVSEHASPEIAFAEIDRTSAQMVRTGAKSDSVELIVIDHDFKIVRRPES